MRDCEDEKGGCVKVIRRKEGREGGRVKGEGRSEGVVCIVIRKWKGDDMNGGRM